MIKKGLRLWSDFRVTVSGEESKRAQGICFDDNPRSQRQASHHSENFDASYGFRRDDVKPFVSCDMSGPCSDADQYFKVFTFHGSSFSASSLDIFRKLRRKIIGNSHCFFRDNLKDRKRENADWCEWEESEIVYIDDKGFTNFLFLFCSTKTSSLRSKCRKAH